MNVFLDDVRQPPDGWIWIKTADEAIVLLSMNVVETISLDHDLGEGKKTGYDVVKWIERKVFLDNYIPPKIYVHSANPVGRKNILMTINKIREKIGDKS